MARYRVGDRYLSQEEYDAESDWKWGAFLFIVGAILAGICTHELIAPHAWPKWAMFTSVIVASVAVGSLLAYFRRIIGAIIVLMIACTLLYYIGLFIWRMM